MNAQPTVSSFDLGGNMSSMEQMQDENTNAMNMSLKRGEHQKL
jgi:hypothetical protein